MNDRPPHEPLVEALDASVGRRHSSSPLIQGLDWRIAPAEFWVFGGSHGSGKSMLLTTVAGLRRPATGAIRHFGRDLATLSESELLELRTRIGFVFKGGGRMFTDLTVAENVALPLRYHRDWTEEQAAPEVAEMLEATGLAPWADELAEAAGSGWQQRVALARALILQPEILFIDEPLAGLDARQRQWWRACLHRLTRGESPARRPIAVVAATNDFALWSGTTHHFALVRDGHWVTLEAGSEPPELN